MTRGTARTMVAGLSTALALLVAPVVVTSDGIGTAQATPGPGTNATALTGLEVDADRHPLGIDNPTPRFSWRLVSARRGVDQTAYKVTVLRGRKALWTTGRVASSTQHVDYSGPELRSRTRYAWTVTIWDDRGARSETVRSGFETGFMDPSQWRAKWIKGTLDDCTERDQCPAPLLRREFRLPKPVRQARLYASGMGYGTYHLNGSRVGNALMDPGFTDYMDRAFYVTHDVTKLLHRGRNALGAELGRGWYGIALGNGAFRYNREADWHAEPELKLELHVRFRDGSRKVIRSGPQGWVTTDGPTRFDDLMLGETFDGRRAESLKGWATPRYGNKGWEPVVVSDGPKGRLDAMDQEPVRVRRTLSAVSITKVGDGEHVYDFGEDVAGTGLITGDLPAGTTVQLRYGERLNEDGQVQPIGEDLQIDRYTGGPGPDRWSAQFSYKGFRYVQVSGVADPAKSLLKAQVWASDMARVGRWKSSHPLVDQIVENSARAYLSNVLSVPTDCPHYEKGAYTGDGQLTAPAYSYLFDNQRVYDKWSTDIAQSVYPDGQMDWIAPSPDDPSISPTNNVHPLTPGWDAALFTVPDMLHRMYGDDRPGLRALPQMKTYRDRIRGFAPTGIVPATDGGLVLNPTGLGDWTAPEGAPTNVSLDGTAWYFEMMRVLEGVARRAGDTVTADDAAVTAEQIRAAFDQRFFNPATNRYEGTPGQTAHQHANAMPAGLGLAEGLRLQAAGDAIAEDVRSRGGHNFAGIMGTRFLFPTLARTGHVDEAWRAITQTTYPSYGFWIEQGWTSLGETWEESARSRNHHMYGTVVQWLYEDVAGYRPVEPGFETIEFRPHLPSTGLDWVKASTRTVSGRVATQWRRTTTGMQLEVTVPAGSTGRVLIPASAEDVVTESGKPLEDARGVEVENHKAGRRVVSIGSGTYRFLVRAAGGSRDADPMTDESPEPAPGAPQGPSDRGTTSPSSRTKNRRRARPQIPLPTDGAASTDAPLPPTTEHRSAP